MPRKNPLASRSQSLRINGRIFPDGRCGWSQQKEVKHPPVNSSDLIDSPSVDEAFDRRSVHLHGVAALRSAKEVAGTLGLSNVANSPKDSKTRAKRGQNGLSRHGARLIRNSAEYLEWRFGRRHLAFATVTLPGITAEENDEVTEKWSSIIKSFCKIIGRKLSEKNLPSWIVGVHEVQTLRRETSGISCLHFHFVFVGRAPGESWALTNRQVREYWRRVLISHVPTLANYDYSATENIVRVRKSVAAYLAKYISKGCFSVGDVAKVRSRKFPSSWYTCSLRLRSIILRSVRMGRHVGEFLSTAPASFFRFRKPIECIDSSGHGFIIGWFGVLNPDWSLSVPAPVHKCEEEYDTAIRRFRFPRRYHDGFGYIAFSRQ